MSKPAPSSLTDIESAVSWGAILVGAFSAAAVSVALAALGVGTGFSLTSPLSDSGLSATTLKWAAGAYLVLTAIISSTIGGYTAGRLRNKWTGVNSQETLFRDTAHGMAAWAFATLLIVAVIGSGTASMLSSAVGGASQGAAQGSANAATSSGTEYYADMILRPSSTATAATDISSTRREVNGIFTRSLAPGNKFSDGDRAYLAQIVSQRSGMSQPEAEKRVDDTITQAKSYVDTARKYTVAFALWSTLALFAGAFAAAAAAIEGGQLRDGRWRGVIFAPRTENNLR
jgi:hypothetical protein